MTLRALLAAVLVAVASPAGAASCPDMPRRQTDDLMLKFFQADETVDARMKVFDAAVTTYFRCYPDRLGVPPGKSDALGKMDAWLKDVAALPPAALSQKLSPEGRNDLKGFAERLTAFKRRYSLYKRMSACVLQDRSSIKRFCLATRDLAKAADLPAGERHELVGAYWSFYFPAFKDDPYARDAGRSAELDESCAVVARARAGGGELQKRFAALSHFDPARAAGNFDGSAARPEATVSVPGLKGPAYSTITPNYRGADGRFHDNSEIKADVRTELLGEARQWRRRADGLDENERGFSRFGCESMSLFYAVAAHLVADGNPEGPELLRRIERLKSLDAAGWAKVPGKTYYAAVDGVTSIFVRYADSWDEVKKNPTTTQILKFGVATELIALQVVPAGKGVVSVASAADRRLAALAGASGSDWEQVRLAFQVREEQLAANAANARGGMGLAARNAKTRGAYGSPAARATKAAPAAPPAAPAEPAPPPAAPAAAPSSPPVYVLTPAATYLNSGNYGSVYRVVSRALKVEKDIHTWEDISRLTSLHNDVVAPAIRSLSEELSADRITVEAPRLTPTRVEVEGKVRQGYWMPLQEAGPKGWIELKTLRRMTVNDAGNLIKGSAYERAVHARLPQIQKVCDRAQAVAQKALTAKHVPGIIDSGDFYVKLGDDGSLTIRTLDFLVPANLRR